MLGMFRLALAASCVLLKSGLIARGKYIMIVMAFPVALSMAVWAQSHAKQINISTCMCQLCLA